MKQPPSLRPARLLTGESAARITRQIRQWREEDRRQGLVWSDELER